MSRPLTIQSRYRQRLTTQLLKASSWRLRARSEAQQHSVPVCRITRSMSLVTRSEQHLAPARLRWNFPLTALWTYILSRACTAPRRCFPRLAVCILVDQTAHPWPVGRGCTRRARTTPELLYRELRGTRPILPALSGTRPG